MHTVARAESYCHVGDVTALIKVQQEICPVLGLNPGPSGYIIRCSNPLSYLFDSRVLDLNIINCDRSPTHALSHISY